MKSILEQLARGQVPFHSDLFENGSAYAVALERCQRQEQRLLDALGRESRPLYDDYYSAQTDAFDLLELQHFLSGFRLGALLMTEVLGDGPLGPTYR